MTDDAASPTTAPVQASPRIYAYYVLAILTLVNFFCYLDRLVISVLVEDLKADLHLSDTQIGMVTGLAFSIFFALMGLPLARLADTHSRPKILSVCLFLWSLATAACGLARNFLDLFIARLCVGVGEGGCVPTSHSLVAEMFTGPARVLGISVVQAGGLVGMSAGLIFAAAVADAYGWRMALYAVGAPGAVLAMILLATVRENRDRVKPQKAHGALQGVGQLIKLPTYQFILLGFACYSFAHYAMLQWAAAFYMRVHELPLAQVGWWVGTGNGIGSIFGILMGGVFGGYLVKRDRRWEMWAPAITIGGAVPLMLLMLIAPNPILSVAFLLLSNTASAFGGAVALASVQSFALPWQRATATAIVMLVTAIIGFGAGPFVAGVLSDLFARAFAVESLRYALLITTTIQAGAGLFYYLASRTLMRDKVE